MMIGTQMANVLVVDDERSVGELVIEALHEHRVELALDGATGLARMRSLHPDLVVLDLNLPDMTGIEVCKTLRADSALAGIKVLMLTGQGSMESIEEGFAVLADDYIVKPFSLRVLAGRVNQLLAKT